VVKAHPQCWCRIRCLPATSSSLPNC
jgi:hypothetical protein